MPHHPPVPLLVETDWLFAHLSAPHLRILDPTTNLVPALETGGVRIQPERAIFEAGHIPGAQFVDLQGDLSDAARALRFTMPEPSDFARRIAAFGISDDSHVILYATGHVWWATRVWWMLRACGFDRASVLNGGFRKWTTEGRPIETGPARRPSPGTFTVRDVRPLFVGREDVLAVIGDGATCAINALLPAAHAGSAPTVFPRAGRIAGSVNVPAASLIDPETGTFRDLEDLRTGFAAKGALDRRVIAYCGGGIAATADAFVLTLLGHPDVAVYDGSMSEWAADPGLPMERDEPTS